MKTKRYLIVDGKTFPVMGISFKEDGSISTIQIYDDFKLRSFVNIDVETEGFEKVDFASCYVEVDTEAESVLKECIELSKGKLDELAHGTIPPIGEKFLESDMYVNFANYHISSAYLDGLMDALKLITSGKTDLPQTAVH